jgi:hypothetical protein
LLDCYTAIQWIFDKASYYCQILNVKLAGHGTEGKGEGRIGEEAREMEQEELEEKRKTGGEEEGKMRGTKTAGTGRTGRKKGNWRRRRKNEKKWR